MTLILCKSALYILQASSYYTRLKISLFFIILKIEKIKILDDLRQIMRSKKISLVVVPLLITACSSNNDKALVQDVYNSQYDCASDWNTELCEEEQSNSSTSGGGSHSGVYYGGSRYLGPQYYDGNRKVNYLGRKVEPSTNLSTGQPFVSRVAKSSSKSSPVRGGFGRSGFSFGG